MPAPVNTTAEYPILRIYRLGGGPLRAETITVTDIDTDFYEYPDFTEMVVDGLLETGTYDDSDGADIVQFSTDRPDDVRQQWEALKATLPEDDED